MIRPADTTTDLAFHLAELAGQEASGDAVGATQSAWRALDADPTSRAAKDGVARVLEWYRCPIDPRRIPDLHRLLLDPELDPGRYAPGGWRLLDMSGGMPTADAAGAASVEGDAFIRALLTETSVTVAAAELMLTALRRWLLLSGRAGDFPQTTAAFVAQAAKSGGAWPFDATERALLDRGDTPLRAAYLPERPVTPSAPIDSATPSAVTTDVASQYEAWPYPVWERVTRQRGTVQSLIDGLGPDIAALPARPEILVAGCGTGREALIFAQRAPDARITAIDLSAASLAYARQRCTIGNVDFLRHDLHDVASLGRAFDVVTSSGVLHHLPEPEAGWAALVDVLKPGGLIRLQVYSKTARLKVRAAQAKLGDLMGRPVTDDLIRTARGRLLAGAFNPLAESPDFYSMGGACDLLLHAHEDPFDVPRIRAAVEANGLEFLGFTIHSARLQAQYRAEHPDDPYHRDFDGWHAIERANPTMYGRMYAFWCRKPLG